MLRPNRKQLRTDTYLALIHHHFPKDLPENVWERIKQMYEEPMINQWLDQAQDFVVRNTECLYGEATRPVLVQEYWIWLWHDTNDHPLCLSPIMIKWTDEDVTDKLITPKEQFEVDAMKEDWESVDGTSCPKHYVYRGQNRGDGSGNSVKLYPKPHKAGTIKVFVLRLPNVMSADDSLVAVEGSHYQAIIDCVLVKAVKTREDMLLLGTQLKLTASEARERTQDTRLKLGTYNGVDRSM